MIMEMIETENSDKKIKHWNGKIKIEEHIN